MVVLVSTAAIAASTLAPAAEAEPAASHQWVALGDSYTAGVIKAAGDVYEVPRDGCERTDQSYPQLIDRDLGSLFDLINVSCGAATVEEVTFRAQEPRGYHFPPAFEDPDYPFPAVPPQSAAMGPGTDVVTVGVSGNTAGFAEILARCLPLGGESGGEGTPCKDELAEGIPDRLNKVSGDYDEMLTVLHERAPDAKILAVGYPTVVPEDTTKCEYNNQEQFGSIAPGDLEWLRTGVLEPLNKVIEDTAGKHDSARFVDLYDSSRDHSVCDAAKWVDGIFTRALDQPALVHPNARGHRNAADHVAMAMLEALDIG
ncbi:SGNH/GDSL hydrolase family protein [Actinokineospora auranticolor]|uniref:GDSL-like lipase/acylhydrolase family protein n=1 Tax=Actinokineospora auranticolor TaxID=155976 RepID=A0A2S6GQD4_9PSEU|nr:SGNH/GDSL hydrolase family protein [Actinokineospora auranticolor]PPK67380.1 GDSL-like lipase/acylhydrolase family protein [Actinokineospora auranticolor]